MYKNYKCVVLVSLALFILTYGAFTVDNYNDSDALESQNKVVVRILQECNLNLKHVIVYDKNRDSSTFRALSTLQPLMTVTLTSNTRVLPLRKNILHRFGYQAIVMANFSVGKYRNVYPIHRDWKHDHNTVIILIPDPSKGCSEMQATFTLIIFLHSFPIYNICLQKDGNPNIFTFDLYGDTNPPYWQTIYKPYGRNRGRYYTRKIDENISQGFSFERTELGDKRGLLEGVRYGTENQQTQENRKFIENILNVKINILIEPKPMSDYRWLISTQHVDVILTPNLTEYINAGKPSFPLDRDIYVRILSHNRGLATPLEKIVEFYGIWTLGSLIILLIITFLTIWLVARKKMSFAAFEVLRLVVNTGLHTPMQNTSLRIFFTVTFLYFIVIQSTFSGNLAKFLTKPKLRRNAETIADLTDPRIEKIYHMQIPLKNYNNKEILLQKEVPIQTTLDCTGPVWENRTSVCIGESSVFEQFKYHQDPNNILYMSKNIGEFRSSFVYQNRFPWRERFDYLIMCLNAGKLLFSESQRENKIHNYISMIRIKRAEIQFRKITLEDLKFAFILLGIGLSLGLICFIIEVLSGRCKFSKLNKKSTKVKIIKINVISNNSPIE